MDAHEIEHNGHYIDAEGKTWRAECWCEGGDEWAKCPAEPSSKPVGMGSRAAVASHFERKANL